jgi:hypothetical protein
VASKAGTLIYMYGIVPADTPAPPADLAGIDGGVVSVHPVGRVAAIVGSVQSGTYSDEALNSRLDDLAWVGDRGLAHERVLDWFAQQGPVIPLSLFSLHNDLGRLEERVRAEEASFTGLLARLEGRREWGVKLWRREADAREGIDKLSASLSRLTREVEEAPPGKRFLLERKRETMRAEELRAVSTRIAHELFGDLRTAADGAVAVPIPAVAAGGERTLLLHAAFLVADTAFETFHAALSAQARTLAGSGFELEFTGPWPPYHFTNVVDD